MVMLYMEAAEGLSANNLAKFTQIAGYVKGLAGPCILLGDWNMEPAELMQSCWLGMLPGRPGVLVPDNAQHTCSSGRGQDAGLCCGLGGGKGLLRKDLGDDRCPFRSPLANPVGLGQKTDRS